MNAALMCFLIGVALGVWGGFAGRDTWWVTKHEQKDAAAKEKDDEIKRLRTIVAAIIGREDRLTAAELVKARDA